MTKEKIDEQIKAIHSATNRALASKETALQFLIDAGIIEPYEKELQDKLEYVRWQIEAQNQGNSTLYT